MGARSTQVVDGKPINKHLADVLMGDGAISLAIHAVRQEVGRRAGIDFDQKKQACSYFHKRLQRKLLKGQFADAPTKKKKQARTSDAFKMKVDFGRKWWRYEVMAMFRADTWQWKHATVSFNQPCHSVVVISLFSVLI